MPLLVLVQYQTSVHHRPGKLPENQRSLPTETPHSRRCLSSDAIFIPSPIFSFLQLLII